MNKVKMIFYWNVCRLNGSTKLNISIRYVGLIQFAMWNFNWFIMFIVDNLYRRNMLMRSALVSMCNSLKWRSFSPYTNWNEWDIMQFFFIECSSKRQTLRSNNNRSSSNSSISSNARNNERHFLFCFSRKIDHRSLLFSTRYFRLFCFRSRQQWTTFALSFVSLFHRSIVPYLY